ncbi:rhodanese-like domain-containing protein [Streptomyces massasporeus]|uniref:rhodanese-like domain-containing protein n=1 Tax=Streptomyces massasporeus TaxID=67324 RepID=UPI0036A9C0F9
MFPFPRRTPGCPGTHEALPGVGDGTAVQLGVRETPERRAGHALGSRHLPGVRLPTGTPLPPVARGGPVVATCRSRPVAELPAGQDFELSAGQDVKATDIVSGGMTVRAHEGPRVTCQGGSGGVIP